MRTMIQIERMATRLDGQGVTSPPPQARRAPDQPELTDGPGVGERFWRGQTERVDERRDPSF
ncbi:hypothetical protein PISMIDRAFT_17992 [Pisolithus microcarpus 441]|uniref:Uncharacterized protein n=1 Tax=Pisolithus microcarpus 441 TaxID=765257 RepID=A0A0C9Z068_9AGAM|nr:hypothetical protein PISMIDRAFT_17992 [Pisolithus microcarpus 441]